MHRAAKVDANQTEITAALRQMGATVQHIHTVGKGCPDLLVGAQLFTPHLSPLQARLLPYLAAGWSSKQIANELHLAERTVRDQTCRILYALALSNRTQVGMWAVVTRQVDIEHVRGLLLQQAPHLERVVQP
jgi:DNA-binding NarL/FixJ family response regulator